MCVQNFDHAPFRMRLTSAYVQRSCRIATFAIITRKSHSEKKNGVIIIQIGSTSISHKRIRLLQLAKLSSTSDI